MQRPPIGKLSVLRPHLDKDARRVDADNFSGARAGCAAVGFGHRLIVNDKAVSLNFSDGDEIGSRRIGPAEDAGARADILGSRRACRIVNRLFGAAIL
jgi:hypothetical protein